MEWTSGFLEITKTSLAYDMSLGCTEQYFVFLCVKFV